MTTQSPRPWSIDIEREVWSSDRDLVFSLGDEDRQEDITYMLRAANSHDDLVAALRALLPRFEAVCPSDDGIDPDDQKRIDMARAALTKAIPPAGP